MGSEIRIERSIEPLAAEWDELADRLGAPPQMRPGWRAPWARAFATGELELVVARDGGRLVGILPLQRRRGVLRGLANYHSPGFDALAEGDDVLDSLCATALSAGRRLSLPLVDSDGKLAQAAEADAQAERRLFLRRPMQSTPVVEVGTDWDAYMEGLGRSFRKELRRHRRRFEELGETEFEVSDGTGELQARLEEVFAVECTGWKAEAGTAILSQPHTHRFYSEMSEWAAQRGFLRLLVLRVEGTAIAVDLALEHRGVRYMLKGGFDPAHSRLAPGTLLLERGLRHAFESGLERVELGGGDDEYKLKWTRALRERDLIQAFARSPAGLVDYAAFAFARPLARRVLRRDS